MEFIDKGDQNRQQLFNSFEKEDIQYYMYKLLSAVDYAHSKGIMHRDIKPGNIMIDDENGILKLVDWGLADYFSMDKSFSTAGTRHYKSAEAILGLKAQDYAVDIWALGILMAGWCFKDISEIEGLYDFDNLKTITRIIGTQKLRDFYNKYEPKLPGNSAEVLVHNDRTFYKGLGWDHFVNEDNYGTAGELEVDLISKMLVFDP